MYTALYTCTVHYNRLCARYDSLEVEGVCIGEALRSHAEAIGSVVTDIQENAGNPDQIRMSLAQVCHEIHSLTEIIISSLSSGWTQAMSRGSGEAAAGYAGAHPGPCDKVRTVYMYNLYT